MNEALAGTAYLAIDGKSVQLAGEFTYKPSTNTREPLIGMDAFHGFKSKPTQGEISAKIRDSSRVSVTALGNITDATITVELLNGKTVVGRNMCTAEPPETEAEEGTISIRWFGPQVGEV